jgi:hypothetical protein
MCKNNNRSDLFCHNILKISFFGEHIVRKYNIYKCKNILYANINFNDAFLCK